MTSKEKLIILENLEAEAFTAARDGMIKINDLYQSVMEIRDLKERTKYDTDSSVEEFTIDEDLKPRLKTATAPTDYSRPEDETPAETVITPLHPEPAAEEELTQAEVKDRLLTAQKNGTDVGAILTELGYGRLSLVPPEKYKELLAKLGDD